MTTFNATLRKGLAAALLMAAPLAACSNVDRVVTGTAVSPDVRARHPIVLTNAPQTLDIFVPGAAGRLDNRQIDDIRDFAKNYNNAGTGVIQILAPRGSAQDAAAQRVVGEIRSQLSGAGVKGYVDVGVYHVADARLAAPVRLSYHGLEARVASRCGEWPEDLASGTSLKGWENRPYYNLGCATQQNLAAQIADPRDLVRPRHMQPADGSMRVRAITAVRAGKNPTTEWPSSANPIGNVLQ
ncbi:MAG: CpaD family pilus assembly protein [Methylobacteriaceae bacterium]|nr:CpaD family pilus assembly protein [Methylobacteriaceae bacterium]